MGANNSRPSPLAGDANNANNNANNIQGGGEVIRLAPTGPNAPPRRNNNNDNQPSSQPTSSPPKPPLAAAYFGESTGLYFGPHFVVNSPYLHDVLAGVDPQVSDTLLPRDVEEGGGGNVIAPAAGPVDTNTTRGPLERVWKELSVMARSMFDAEIWDEDNENRGFPGVDLNKVVSEEELRTIIELYKKSQNTTGSATATLQALVNLKKNTVRLVKIEQAQENNNINASASTSAPPFQTQGESQQPPTLVPLASTLTSEHQQLTPAPETIISSTDTEKDVILNRRDGSKRLGFVGRPSLQQQVLHGAEKGKNVDGGDAYGFLKPRKYGPLPAGLNQRFSLPVEDYIDVRGLLAVGAVSGNGNGFTGTGTRTAAAVKDNGIGGGESSSAGGPGDMVEEGETEGGKEKGKEVVSLTKGKAAREYATFYPIVIVIEAFEGLEGPGNLTEPDEDSVNMQMTYATILTHQNSDLMDVKVLKQKVMIDNTLHILQEIYGFTDRSGTGSEEPTTISSPATATSSTTPLSPTTPTTPITTPEDQQTMRECVVCMSEPKDTAVLPCRHLCLCRGCAEVLRFQGRNNRGNHGANQTGPPKCPICRQVFTSLLQLQLNVGKKENLTTTPAKGDAKTETELQAGERV
ncbi:hypothetical protein HDU76_014128 [Blyttiomyces sp. JEL0837]|nr:hypothetical protein HDU76_014128 [Blyttiomyces sp. JEL0837]